VRFPTPGEEFEGKYRIESVLGSGGFARVYKAWESGLERPVALKILRPPSLEGHTADERDRYLMTVISRFEREGHLLSKLKSPHTVTVYSFGKSIDGLLYMALEYIDGLSLAQIREDGCPLPPERVVKILSQVLLSLKEAHAMGMLHRDLKPANIMVFDHLGETDQVKLLDFGIAKTFGDTNRKDLTSDGTLIGTPRYMAPEQIQGDGVAAPSSDIYSLGLVAYELLTGERAIKTDNSLQIIGQQMGPISFTVPSDLGLPPMLRGVINRMIDKNLSRRYQTVSEVLQDLCDPGLFSFVQNEPATMKLTAIQVETLPEIGRVVEMNASSSADEVLTISSQDVEPPDPDYVSHLEAPGSKTIARKHLLWGLAAALSILLIGLVSIIWARREMASESAQRSESQLRTILDNEPDEPGETALSEALFALEPPVDQLKEKVTDEALLPEDEKGNEAESGTLELWPLDEPDAIGVPLKSPALVRQQPKRRKTPAPKEEPKKFEPKLESKFPMIE